MAGSSRRTTASRAATGPREIPSDYDRDPGRFRTARAVQRRHGLAPDVHERVAGRLVAEGCTPVLDVGCGEGELAGHLPDGAWVGLDSSARMLARAPQPSVLGDAASLPFPDRSFAAIGSSTCSTTWPSLAGRSPRRTGY